MKNIFFSVLFMFSSMFILTFIFFINKNDNTSIYVSNFYTNTCLAKNIGTNYVLVNKYYYLPSTYIPNDLVLYNGKYLVKEALDSYKLMEKDIKNNNMNIRIVSAYRSYSYQKELYDKYVSIDGKDKADTYSARAGFSEHQTGLVIDIDNGKLSYQDFDKTDEYTWMINNSYKYGFILRYPLGKEYITGYNYESWHFRYVGLDIAKYIYEHNITFDEYYDLFLK